MTTAEVFTEAARLVREGWCQGAYARDKDGRGVRLGDEKACEWCVVGALYRATDDGARGWAAEREASSALGLRGSVVSWNDDPARTQAEVAALLDRLAREAS